MTDRIKYFISALSLCVLSIHGTDARDKDVTGRQLYADSTVVTQFAEIPAWSVSGAVSTAKGEKLEKTFTQNLLNTLYGEIPGLTLMRGSGDPGDDSPTLNARGFNTFSTTDRSVLVIVDGFESTLDNLAAQEIESISLLKDAAATALYGMRAANGVLYVTTKRGKNQPLEVNFSAQAGFNNPFRMPKFLGSYDYAMLYDEARVNDGLTPVYEGTEALEAYRTGAGDSFLYPDVDWYDAVLKKFSANQNYDLNFRGGNEIVRYFALLNVSDNNGFFRGTDSRRENNSNAKYTRYNVRANVDVNITKRLTASMNLAANIADKFSPSGGSWGVYNRLSLLPPNSFPIYNPDGSYGGNATFSNPVGDLLEKGLNSYNSRNIQTNLRLRYDLGALVEGLSVSAVFSFNNWFRGNSNKSKKYPYYSLAKAGDEYYYNQYSEQTSMTVDDSGATQWRNTSFVGSVNYANTFAGRHRVTVDAEYFTDETYKEYDSSLRDSQFPYRFLGVRGRASYAYDQRYLADFTFNYSGSDLYAPGKRFGLFPAASVGWIASNEGFLKDDNTLTFLKLRASYGLVGNAAVVGSRRYAYFQDYRYSSSYYKGETQTSVSGLMEDNIADVNRTWEKERRFNIGVDMTLWKKLEFSFDYFLHKRSDILVSPSGEIPDVFGKTYSELNLGRTTNHGFEVSLAYSDRLACGLEYYAKGNFWFARNKIDYMAEELRQYDNLVRTGYGIDQAFGLRAIGLFRDEKDIEDSPQQTFGTVRPGDIKYEDVNKDGKVDDQDVCPIGKTGTPEISGSLTLGLKWAGFDLEAMFYGVGNRVAYLSGSTYWSFMNQYAAPVSALERWTEDTKDTAVYPRLSTQANANNTKYSTFWQHDGSFLKLKYVELGYTLPRKASDVLRAKAIRFFVNGTNLFSVHGMHDLKNADPEGIAGVPAMRTVSGGLKLTF